MLALPVHILQHLFIQNISCLHMQKISFVYIMDMCSEFQFIATRRLVMLFISLYIFYYWFGLYSLLILCIQNHIFDIYICCSSFSLSFICFLVFIFFFTLSFCDKKREIIVYLTFLKKGKRKEHWIFNSPKNRELKRWKQKLLNLGGVHYFILFYFFN